ncbi:MAG: topoisomerase subunit, partial [Microbacteriaceae bacterium]|nr:topoisomerase subunit [Microbacteriaceae bacterium]
NLGRLVRLSPIDLPVVPANSIQLAAGVKLSDYLGLDQKKEQVLALVSLESDAAIALGTRQGVVKRVAAGDYPAKPDFELIALKPGDQVVGARQGGESDELLFITSDAQLLHFSAAAVRPQGRSAAGMAGISLGQAASVIFFGAVDPGFDPVVATISTSSSTIAGADFGRAKVSRLSEFPSKGRATGGVRAHSFLKGEDSLALAWAGQGPATAVGPDGSTRRLPEEGAKRDASGTPLDAVIGSIGSIVRSD